MTEIESDGRDEHAGSVLVTGPSPDRFERAAKLLSDDVVVAPAVDGDLDAALAAAGVEDPAVAPEDDRSQLPLSDLGIAISDVVADRSAPDVLVAVGDLASSDAVDAYSLFRFLHLTRWRVAAAGGRLICTLGGGVDPITVKTLDEVFDQREQLGSLHDSRTVGGLSP
jgi:threonine dehydrogenase-like Zn-dependent dehydrogenase